MAAPAPSPQAPQHQRLHLPRRDGSVRFAVIGDSGTGDDQQYEIGLMLARFHDDYPFDFVLMLGDNLYGSEKPRHYLEKFERPYSELLTKGVKFYASLGNHDDTSQRFYKAFNTGGELFYDFKKGNAHFFALYSTYMDPKQLTWLTDRLQKSNAEWKIAFMHHPLYSSGRRHGPSLDLRQVLEPLFVKYGVNVVLAGHEHFYERIKPQKGIYHFISGAAGKLRRDGLRRTGDSITAKGFDRDRHFMLIEIHDNQMFFQAVTRRGATVDSGVITLGERFQTAGRE